MEGLGKMKKEQQEKYIPKDLRMTERALVCAEAALAGGRAMMSVLPSSKVVLKEGNQNFATACDVASEQVIIDLIEKEFPKDKKNILSEESRAELKDPLERQRLWVIDPVDGTVNLYNGRNYSCVSVGYAELGIPKVVAVFDPFRNELFLALRNKGSYLNGNKLNVRNIGDFGEATVATDPCYDPEVTKGHLEVLQNLEPVPWISIRGSAIQSMCDIAAGRQDLFFHTHVKPWDNIASLVVTEAGGIVRGLDGRDINFMDEDIAVGNPILVDKIVQVIRRKGLL